MKIRDIVELLKLSEKCDFQFVKRTPEGQLPVYAGEGIVYVSDSVDTGSVGIFLDSKQIVDNYKRDLKQVFPYLDDGREIELGKYVSVFLLLNAMNKVNGNNLQVLAKDIQNGVNRINDAITKELDFSEIDALKALKEKIENGFYRDYLFTVTEYNVAKKQVNSLLCKRSEYKFGNLRYYNGQDVVRITVYKDWFELLCEVEGKYHNGALSLYQGQSLEGKILGALDGWRDVFWK